MFTQFVVVWNVHKDKVSACLITVDDNGKEQHEIREFSSFTQDLQKMKTWLIENSCPVVAMESTGVYWHPVYNTIEDTMEVVLVNARHIKNVPAEKQTSVTVNGLPDCFVMGW